jgi:hypothetical protein
MFVAEGLRCGCGVAWWVRSERRRVGGGGDILGDEGGLVVMNNGSAQGMHSRNPVWLVLVVMCRSAWSRSGPGGSSVEMDKRSCLRAFSKMVGAEGDDWKWLVRFVPAGSGPNGTCYIGMGGVGVRV